MILILFIICFVCVFSISILFTKKSTFAQIISVCNNLGKVIRKIESSYLKYKKINSHLLTRPPRLVAVSKTKPIELILEPYSTGKDLSVRITFRSYRKATNPVLLQTCEDIQWHFIGHLQRKNAKLLCQVPKLFLCESDVDREVWLYRGNNWRQAFIQDFFPWVGENN